jgi:hypothetical protein
VRINGAVDLSFGALTHESVLRMQADVSAKQQRCEDMNEKLTVRVSAINDARANMESRLRALAARGDATPAKQAQARIDALQAAIAAAQRQADECRRKTAALGDWQARRATLQSMQELADSREVAANRRNEAIKNEISKVERDIAEIAATESFKMRVASQTQLRTQCKELKAKIAQLH